MNREGYSARRTRRASRTVRLAVAILVATAVARESDAQARRARVDTVYLARDLDGNGRLDHVVVEVRDGEVADLHDSRLAIYLDGAPGASSPAWTSDWTDSGDGRAELDTALALPNGGTALVIVMEWADAMRD